MPNLLWLLQDNILAGTHKKARREGQANDVQAAKRGRFTSDVAKGDRATQRAPPHSDRIAIIAGMHKPLPFSVRPSSANTRAGE